MGGKEQIPFSLYSELDRDHLLSQLNSFTDLRPEILGTVLVGSGSKGFKDRYSDIDLVLVMDKEGFDANAASVQQSVINTHRAIFHTSYHHRDDVVVSAFYLPDYQEVDLGFWLAETLFATKHDWRLLNAKSPHIEQEITHALTHHPHLPREHEPRISGDNPLWQYINSLYISSARKDEQKIQQVYAHLHTFLKSHGFSPLLTEGSIEKKVDILTETIKRVYPNELQQKQLLALVSGFL